MATYLVQASYTSEALASLIKNPENRTEVVKKVAKKLGGKLSASWLSFGEYDLVMVCGDAGQHEHGIVCYRGGRGRVIEGREDDPLDEHR